MKIQSKHGLFFGLIATVCAFTSQGAMATLIYQWKFDGATGVPAVQNGGGTLVPETVGALGIPVFTGTGSTGLVGDNAMVLSNDYTDGLPGTTNGEANRATANTTNTNQLTGLGTLNAFTVTMWVKTSALNGFPRFLQAVPSTAANSENNGIGIAGIYTSGRNLGNHVDFGINGRTYDITLNAGVPYTSNFGAGQWVFVAFTYDGTGTLPNSSTFNSTEFGTTNNAVVLSGSSSASVVVSGSVAASGATVGTTTAGPVNFGTASHVYLGNRNTGFRGLTGSFDDVRIYNNQLTVAQLEAVRLEGAPPPPPGGVAYFWKGTNSTSWTGNNWSSSVTGAPLATPPNNGTAALTFAADNPLNMDATTLGTDWNLAALNFNTNSFYTQNGPMTIGGTHNITLGAAGINLSADAGQVTLNSSGQVILGAEQTWTNPTATPFEVASQVSGAFKLFTAGAGTTILSGANTYSGGTSVSAGTLKIGNALALGSATAPLTVSGTLDLQAFSPTAGTLFGSGIITSSVNGTSVVTINGTSPSNFAGAINNGDATKIIGLVKNGTGTLTLGGLSSFTGNITVNQGSLIGTTPLFGGNNTSNFGNLQNGGRTITVAPGAIILLNSNNVFASQFTNFGNLPEVILNGSKMTAVNYNAIGKVTMNGGTLESTSGSVSTSYRGYQLKGDITATGAAASFIANTTPIGNHLNTNTLFNVDTDSSLTISTPLFNQSLNFVSAPDVPLTGGFTKAGPGILTMTAANSFTGPATVLQGTLSLGSPTSLSDTALLTVADTNASVLVLNYIGTDVVGAFDFDAISGLTGTFGAEGSGADHEYPWITGTGFISVPSADPYLDWIEAYYPAPDPLGAKSADPDGDGLTNHNEFAFNSLPNSGAASGKMRSRVKTVAGAEALVITFPARVGAVFTGSAPATATVAADLLKYFVEGSNNLGTFDQPVSDITGTALDSAGLPPLTGPDAAWEYRTFRLDGDVGGVTSRGPLGFLRVGVNQAP